MSTTALLAPGIVLRPVLCYTQRLEQGTMSGAAARIIVRAIGHGQRGMVE
jgi:hypothetical protein